MQTVFILILSITFSFNTLAQNSNDRKLFSLDGNDIGGYLGFNGRITTVNSLSAGLIDLRIAVVVNKKWAFGFNTSGLLNDRHLNTLVKDDVYHLMGSYQGLFIERIFEINEDFRYSFSFMIGQGNAKNEYCRSVIADKKWYEEIIDQTDFYIIQPTFDFYYNLFDNFWFGLNAGFNLTTSIRLMETDEALLNKANGGLSLKYGLF